MAYSLASDPDRVQSVLLFLKHWEDNSFHNKLFSYIPSQAVSWQVLVSPSADVEALSTDTHESAGASEYQAIAASKSRPDLLPSSYLPKTLAFYFSALALAAVVPYYKMTGARNKLEQHFNKALRELNKINN